MADRRRRGWTDAGAEALVILIVLGLLAVAAFVGWIAGRATREETTTVTVGSTSSTTSTTSTIETTTSSTAETKTGTTSVGATGTGTTGTTSGGGSPGGGDPEAGTAIFANYGCGSCHTLEAAGTSGNIGPNLDEAKPSRTLVVARVTNGKGAMPSFKDTLNDKQIRDVAAYVATSTGGG
jgi:cytochrome c6